MFIPKELKIGYQNRTDTYSGKLAYITYIDHIGKHRKENSFNSWRDKTIEVDSYDNIPTDGFVLNKKVGGNRYSWNPRQTYSRVYDPRGFEFEITIPNLLYILENTNCIKGKGLEGEFVYGWDGTELTLIPTSAPDYNGFVDKAEIMYNPTASYITPKMLKVGYLYTFVDGEERIYLGKFNDKFCFSRTNDDNQYCKTKDLSSISKKIKQESSEIDSNFHEIFESIQEDDNYYKHDSYEHIQYTLEEFINVLNATDFCNWYGISISRNNILEKSSEQNRLYKVDSFANKIYKNGRWDNTTRSYTIIDEYSIEEYFDKFKPCYQKITLSNNRIIYKGKEKL